MEGSLGRPHCPTGAANRRSVLHWSASHYWPFECRRASRKAPRKAPRRVLWRAPQRACLKAHAEAPRFAGTEAPDAATRIALRQALSEACGEPLLKAVVKAPSGASLEDGSRVSVWAALHTWRRVSAPPPNSLM